MMTGDAWAVGVPDEAAGTDMGEWDLLAPPPAAPAPVPQHVPTPVDLTPHTPFPADTAPSTPHDANPTGTWESSTTSMTASTPADPAPVTWDTITAPAAPLSLPDVEDTAWLAGQDEAEHAPKRKWWSRRALPAVPVTVPEVGQEPSQPGIGLAVTATVCVLTGFIVGVVGVDLLL